MLSLSCFLRSFVRRVANRLTGGRRWASRTLVVGPAEPVDGDSVSCTKALLNHLRKMGKQAYTLPTLAMYAQIEWILNAADLHPACLPVTSEHLTTGDLQKAFDALIAVWRPEEIVLVDGPVSQLGFDPRGIPVFNIDHHMGKGAQDNGQAYIQPAPSAGCLLIRHFGVYDPILLVSILTDTFWLRQNHPSEAIESLCALREHGLTDELLIDIQHRLMVPKNPAIIDALRFCHLRHEGDAVMAVLKDANPEIHRGIMGELGYFFRYICVVRGDGYISFRTTDRSLKLRPLAEKWNGGGHENIAAGHLVPMTAEAFEELCSDFLACVRRKAE